MAKERQSNIELCRLVSILLVMIGHTTGNNLGSSSALGLLLLDGFAVVGVNVFILITGYFSATPKKTSLINLAFICLFWGAIKVFCQYETGATLSYKYVFFITTSNWFIASYICLLFTTPLLNICCKYLNKRQLWGGYFC